MRALKGYRRLALVAKDEEFVVMLEVQYVAYLRPSDLCNLTAGQVIRPLQGSGASSCALLLAPQEELEASKTAESNASVLLAGHLSVALGKALTRYTAGETAATRLWSRSQARYAVNFARWAETSGVHVITTDPYSVRHGGASSDALWRTRSLMEFRKRGRWRSLRQWDRFSLPVRSHRMETCPPLDGGEQRRNPGAGPAP